MNGNEKKDLIKKSKKAIKAFKKVLKVFDEELKSGNADLICEDFLREYGDLLEKIADDLKNFHKKW